MSGRDKRIGDYAIIGNSRSAALVSNDGSVDWLCCPRFDSQPLFSALLGDATHGCWRIAPSHGFLSTRRYVPDTNVLLTSMRSPRGEIEITDCMPVLAEEDKRRRLSPDHELLRHVRCVSGEVEVEVEFIPRAHFGRDKLRVRDSGKLGLRVEAGRGVYWLRSTHQLHPTGDRAHGPLLLREGDTAAMSLTYTEDAPAVLPDLATAEARIAETTEWWRGWASATNYSGPYKEAVTRSALALKLMAYAPSGAIIAAPTTSLPERAGGELNWDYRYCWLRDASMTVRALDDLGFHVEAEAFVEWLLHATRTTQPRLDPMYTIYGEAAPAERELLHLPGYRASRPVRTGNAARGQKQLDIHGQVIDAVARLTKSSGQLDRDTERVLIRLGEFVCNHWHEVDDGIWEPRAPQQHRTHSRLLCWVALDRLCAMGARGLFRSSAHTRFAAVRDRIRQDVEQNAWNERLQTYTSTFGGEEVDASLLLIPWYGFEAATSSRMRGTYRAVAGGLRAGPDLLYRYRANRSEGAFALCSFWEVEYLVSAGRIDEARELFERLLGYANDVGLFAEEIDPATGDALGNFPQAYTHVGLISAAIALRSASRTRREGETVAEEAA